MNFDDYFDNLSELELRRECDEKCCDKFENYVIHNGMTTCKICYNVVSNISDNAEWRYYGSEDSKSSDPTRCGMPTNILLPKSSIGSTLNFKNNSKSMNQIRRYQNFNGMPYKERSKYKVFNIITETCQKNNISTKIINEAKSLYNNISDIKISRGSNRTGIIAACVYFSCKECDVPRSTKEISDIFNIPITTMTKGVKNFQEILNLDRKNKTRIKKITMHPIDFIDRFSNNMDINIEIIKNICNCCIENNIISQNTPQSIAAGCIYYYIKKKDLNVNKKNLSDVCKISEVTINKCYKNISVHDELFQKYFQ